LGNKTAKGAVGHIVTDRPDLEMYLYSTSIGRRWTISLRVPHGHTDVHLARCRLGKPRKGVHGLLLEV